MLSNAYFLAKFRFDTAENEPAKNLQNFRLRKIGLAGTIMPYQLAFYDFRVEQIENPYEIEESFFWDVVIR